MLQNLHTKALLRLLLILLKRETAGATQVLKNKKKLMENKKMFLNKKKLDKDLMK